MDSPSFSDLGLHPTLEEAVSKAGYLAPTPIQNEAIPHVLAGRDVLGCARTGTGKTAAFALPILDHLMTNAVRRGRVAIRALVLAPTRELAAQIAESFSKYSAGSALETAVVFGGVPKRPQVLALRRGVDVLVATPGRLMDLMDDRVVDLRRVETFVLDEADRMLDMGFIQDVRRITSQLPKRRQTLLFSATIPPEIRELSSRLLTDPVRLSVTLAPTTQEPIRHSVYFVAQSRKTRLLLALLADPEIDRALVFTRTKHAANRVAQKLEGARVSSAAIHGNKSQAARERALSDFKQGKTRIVVATDVAARGIDVKDLPYVINFDLPAEPESYVHRVGRTGRAGQSGKALSFCSGEERLNLVAIERFTRQTLERLDVPEGFDPGSTDPVEPPTRRRGGPKREPGRGRGAPRGRRGPHGRRK